MFYLKCRTEKSRREHQFVLACVVCSILLWLQTTGLLPVLLLTESLTVRRGKKTTLYYNRMEKKMLAAVFTQHTF